MIIRTLSVAPIGTNCYIPFCEKTREAIIIDPGGEADKILDVVSEDNLEVKYIICTHGHFDHVGAIADIKKSKNIPFYLHEGDAPFLEPANFSLSLSTFGFSGIEPPKIDSYIDPAKKHSFGTLNFTVLETPGHSPGGVCFLFDKDVFVGDSLFAGSVGRTDLPGGSGEELMHSIKTRLMTLDDSLTVHCGHMNQTTIAMERQNNPFRQHW